MKTLTRRHVLATLSGSAVMLCPALVNAAGHVPWGNIPTTTPVGQSQLIELGEGPAEVEISALAPGEVAVIARPNAAETYARTGQIQYIGILHRTEAQIAAANDRPGVVQDPRYLVVNLVCPHRGKAVGITGNGDLPFACTDRGGRHASDFDASGMGVGGASEGDPMVIPSYGIAANGSAVVLSLA